MCIVTSLKVECSPKLYRFAVRMITNHVLVWDAHPNRVTTLLSFRTWLVIEVNISGEFHVFARGKRVISSCFTGLPFQIVVTLLNSSSKIQFQYFFLGFQLVFHFATIVLGLLYLRSSMALVSPRSFRSQRRWVPCWPCRVSQMGCRTRGQRWTDEMGITWDNMGDLLETLTIGKVGLSDYLYFFLIIYRWLDLLVRNVGNFWE